MSIRSQESGATAAPREKKEKKSFQKKKSENPATW